MSGPGSPEADRLAGVLRPDMALQRAVVVGGGIAGLVAARDLASVGVRVTVLERDAVAGGQVRAAEVAGVTVDIGAESFATRGGAVDALVSELGLDALAAAPNPAGAWLRLPRPAGPGSSVPLPKGGLLGIPAVPLASDVRAVIGWSGAWRAYLDRLRPVLSIGKVHDLGALVTSRMGARVRDRLVAPVVGGVYSAEPEDIDVEAAAPGLNGALTRTGSLSGAVGELRSAAKPGGAVRGLAGGMSGLVAALVSAIEVAGGQVLLGTAAAAITPADRLPDAADAAEDDAAPEVAGAREAAGDSAAAGAPAAAPDVPEGGWLVEDEHGGAHPADVVLLAAPERESVELLAGAGIVGAVAPDATPAEIDVVVLVLDDARLDAQPRGSGLLVVDGAPVRAKALTHATAKWRWLDEAAGPGRHVVRLSYGRRGAPSAIRGLPESEAVAIAVADAADLLGVAIDGSAVAGAVVQPWTGTRPVAAAGREERLAAVNAAVAETPGLELAGAWLAGTGLASVVPDALAAAARLRHEVSRRYLGDPDPAS